MAKLRDNPTAEAILSCFSSAFLRGKEEFDVKTKCVILQEQYRNPRVGDFMRQMLLEVELKTRVIFEVLKELNVFHPDALPDYWMKVVSSLIYAFTSRMPLGIGENSEDFVGKGLVEMLLTTFELMLHHCSVEQDEDDW